MTGQVVAALFGALFGAFSSYVMSLGLAMQDRVRRRRSLATALLYELQSIESMLSQFAEHPDAAMAVGSVSIFEQIPTHIELFDATAVGTILNFRQQILTLYEISSDRTPGHSRTNRERTVAEASRRFLASLRDTRAALVRSGGTPPLRLVDSRTVT